MAFNSYEEFRAAIADSARRYEVVHAMVGKSIVASSSINSLPHLALPDGMATNVANRATGGELLNHTSMLGHTQGQPFIPLRKPRVNGRDWYLYDVQVHLHNMKPLPICEVILADFLWKCSIELTTNAGPWSYAVTGAPDLTRHTSGRGVIPLAFLAADSRAFATGVLANGTGANNLSASIECGESSTQSYTSAPACSVGMLPTALMGPISTTVGRGGMKKVDSVSMTANNSMPAISLFLAKRLLTIPVIVPKGSPEVIGFADQPIFSDFSPSIRLPAGTDGNFACLVPLLHLAKSSANAAVDSDGSGSITLRFVEG